MNRQNERSPSTGCAIYCSLFKILRRLMFKMTLVGSVSVILECYNFLYHTLK